MARALGLIALLLLGCARAHERSADAGETCADAATRGCSGLFACPGTQTCLPDGTWSDCHVRGGGCR